METTELDNNFKKFFNIFHHYSGALVFIVNLIVSIVIITDSDTRAKSYRIYLFALQISSMAIDILIDVYAPIMLINCPLVFSDSILAKHVDIMALFTIGFFFFCETVTCYFYCVYYRRSVVLPPGSRFCYNGRRLFALMFGLQVYSWSVCAATAIIINGGRTPLEQIPRLLYWLNSNGSFAVFLEIPYVYEGGAYAVTWGFGIFIIIVLMILDVQRELKNGMHHTSSATRKFQKRAITALTLQGTVPGLFYAVPVCGLGAIYLFLLWKGIEIAARNQTASILSALLFSLISFHTFAHSLTILACSPAYRRTIVEAAKNCLDRLRNAVMNSVDIPKQKTSRVSIVAPVQMNFGRW